MSEKNYKPLLIIGIAAIAVAMTGIYLLEPPSQAEAPLPSETPSQFEMVLTPEDLARASQPAAATVSVARATGFPSAAPGPSAITVTASSRPTTARPSASASASRTARRSSGAAATRSAAPRTAAPTATRRPAASANEIQPTVPPIPTEPSLPADPTAAPDASASMTGSETAEQTPVPEDSSAPTETDNETSGLRSAASLSSRRQAAPVVSRGGGLLAAADSKYSITMDGVEEAGGMKLIEGFRANGQAVLRDIRNTLLSSSSLVKAYKNGEEIGGFETIGTGTVVELQNRAGEVVDTAVVLIPGDVTGSGVLDITQLARVAAAVDGSCPLDGVQFMAADVDGSGVLDEGDLLAMSYALNRRQT